MSAHRHVRARATRAGLWFVLLAIAGALAMSSARAAQSVPAYPRLADGRLQISLYADDPDIMTPIGMATDARGRLYVIESHTHTPPAGYDGPRGDLIKVFEGTRPDGRFDRSSVFADDLFQAQSIAFSPQGELYIVCTRGLFILHDRDGDGRSEARTRILTIDPYERRANAHGQMQGISFSADGWVYVGRGTHVGGAYTWVGADGTRLAEANLDGGDIVRIRPDGTQLERVATGFWNPFASTFDPEGRLLSVDNDPDARGPNRLLHIVPGGDYGYKRYGRFGLHPYQAWEGELPGTLPTIHGVGEAPTAVIHTSAARLPADYGDAILVSEWAEHTLSLFRTRPEGASVRATREVFLQGEGFDTVASPFRPSGMTTTPDGAIFISDWMLINYTTHKRGRIWKVTARDGVSTVPPRPAFASPSPSPAVARLNTLYTLSAPADYEILRQALTDDDPFIRNAAVTTLAKRPVFHSAVVRDLEHTDDRVRLGALLTLRRADVYAGPSHAAVIAARLGDTSTDVVQMAMVWAGEKTLGALAPDVDAAMSRPGLSVNRRLFDVWLATMQILQAQPVPQGRAGAGRGGAPGAGTGGGAAPAGRGAGTPAATGLGAGAVGADFTDLLDRVAFDEARPVLLRTAAMRWLPDTRIDEAETHTRLSRLAREASDQPDLQIEALRRLASSTRPERMDTLRAVAFDRSGQAAVRSEAVAALAAAPDASLLPLLDDPSAVVRLEAARSLRGAVDQPGVRDALAKTRAAAARDRDNAALASQLGFLLGTEPTSRPTSVGDWQTLLATGGSADAGRRVFFSSNSACHTCHAAENRGGVLGAGFSTMPFGPDLTFIGRGHDRRQLIESIVAPSNAIAPEMQGWFVRMKSGDVHTGRQIDQERCCIQLIMIDGQEHNFPRADIDTWGAMELSLMPPALHAGMAVEEFRDLVAYLESLQ